MPNTQSQILDVISVWLFKKNVKFLNKARIFAGAGIAGARPVSNLPAEV